MKSVMIELVGGPHCGAILELDLPKSRTKYQEEWYSDTQQINEDGYLIFRYSKLDKQLFIDTDINEL